MAETSHFGTGAFQRNLLKLICCCAILGCSLVHSETTNIEYTSPFQYAEWPLINKYALVWNSTGSGQLQLIEGTDNAFSSLYDISAPTDGQLTLLSRIVSNKSFESVGWDFLWVAPAAAGATLTFNSGSNPTLTNRPNESQAYYYAGYSEGYVTHDRLWQVFTATATYTVSPAASQWIDEHIAYMRQMILAYENAEAPFNEEGGPIQFWHSVQNWFALMQGLADGYTAASGGRYGTIGDKSLSFRDMFLLSFNDEIDDLNVKYSVSETAEGPDDISMRLMRQHCSALIKNTGTDILFSHVTWGDYFKMVRQYKIYDFSQLPSAAANPAVASVVAMSAVAGTISSGDDWYILSNKFAVMETTNGYYNSTLAKLYVQPQSVSEFLRVMVANLCASSGKNWADLFVYNNSGTYCNQYMVLNTNLFDPTQSVQPGSGLLYVVEQAPGTSEQADQSLTINTKGGYWASYNLPFYPRIYNYSGFFNQWEKYGPIEGYHTYARAQIFARNASDVQDLEGMQKMMRYNSWKTDPLSIIPRCDGHCSPLSSPWLAITARGDQVPLNATFPTSPAGYSGNFQIHHFGGKDAKIGSASSLRSGGLTGWVINGPTAADGNPPFDFSSSIWSHQIPLGSPVTYHFPWVSFTVPKYTPTSGPSMPESHPMNGFQSLGIVLGCVAFLLLALKAYGIWQRRQEERDAESVRFAIEEAV